MVILSSKKPLYIVGVKINFHFQIEAPLQISHAAYRWSYKWIRNVKVWSVDFPLCVGKFSLAL